MSVNNLLIWMSARGEGSWQQFRAAVEEFHVESSASEEDGETGENTTSSDLPVYQALCLGFQRLGHVEFFSAGTDKDWRVAPPALAAIRQGEQWIGIACGARSPGLYQRLCEAKGQVSWETLQVPGMSDRIRVLASHLEELRAAAESNGFNVQESAPLALLAAIPPVDDPGSRVSSEPPTGPGWTIEKFSTSTLRWCKAERRDFDVVQSGLFRFRMGYQRFHLLRWRGRTFRVPVQVGKFAVLRRARRRALFAYDAQQSVLSVPAICRPPFLIERALVLCSGLLPRFDQASSLLEYTDVPWEVARLAAQLLHQEVQRQ